MLEDDPRWILAKKYPNLLMVNPVTGKMGDYPLSSQYPLGWVKIIEDLVSKASLIPVPEQVFFTQIKEKFGTLRAYTSYSYKELDFLIKEAVDKSSQTCEDCGKSARLSEKDTWYATLCAEHE